MSLLLPLLLLYNSTSPANPRTYLNTLTVSSFFLSADPMFPTVFLINSWIPGMLDAILQASFLCALLMFWLCIYHGLRQNERKLLTFYLPKLIVVTPIWLCAIILATWEKCNELKDPTYSHFVDAGNYAVSIFAECAVHYEWISFSWMMLSICRISKLLSMWPAPYTWCICRCCYWRRTASWDRCHSLVRHRKTKITCHSCSIDRTFSHNFPDMRLKFLTVLMVFVLSISITVTVCRFGIGILEDNFVATLNTTYTSSAQFMCFYGLLNFYLYTMAYVYSPSGRPLHGKINRKQRNDFETDHNNSLVMSYGTTAYGNSRNINAVPLTYCPNSRGHTHTHIILAASKRIAISKDDWKHSELRMHCCVIISMDKYSVVASGCYRMQSDLVIAKSYVRCAWQHNPNLYLPLAIAEPNITKDNPAFSMINDSDEDVVYGSDDESRRPLNSAGKGNDYDSD